MEFQFRWPRCSMESTHLLVPWESLLFVVEGTGLIGVILRKFGVCMCQQTQAKEIYIHGFTSMNLSELFGKSLDRCSWWKCISIVNVRGLDLHSNTGNHSPFGETYVIVETNSSIWFLCKGTHPPSSLQQFVSTSHLTYEKKKKTNSTFHQKTQCTTSTSWHFMTSSLVGLSLF